MPRNFVCCVPGCFNASANPEITFLGFPTPPERRRQWINSLGLTGVRIAQTSTRVCSAHFTPDDFHGSGYLKKSANPSINEVQETSSWSWEAVKEEKEIECQPFSVVVVNPAIEVFQKGENTTEFDPLDVRSENEEEGEIGDRVRILEKRVRKEFSKEVNTSLIKKCSTTITSESDIPEENLIISSDNSEIIKSSKKLHSCVICNKTFKYSVSLRNHIRVHTGEKPYQCEFCGKSFTGLSNLINHRKIHNNERPFECEECGKKFTVNSKLKVHTRIHTGERPYRCDFCDKAFTSWSNFHYHKLGHTDVKPFVCHICGKGFSVKFKLNAHKRNHTYMKSQKVINFSETQPA